MGELIKLELKKLCRKRLTIIVTVGCFLGTLLFFSLPFLQYRAWDENGTMLSGKAAVAYKKGCYENISGILTNARIADDLREYKKMANNPDNLISERGSEISGEKSFNDEIYYSYLAPKVSYLNMLGNTYVHNEMGYLNIPGISAWEAEHFYETRNRNTETWIEHQEGFSDREKEYWKAKNTKISEPYIYGYPLGWSSFGDTLQMLIICIMGICICTASVFSGEYQAGTAAVILASRYGKTRAVCAKIISAVLFGTVVFIINASAALLLPLMTFGMEGGGLPLQIMDSYCPYNLNFLQASLIGIGLAYLVTLGLLAVTLFCSAVMKSAFSVLITDVLLIFIPVFLSPGSNGLWQHIYALFPYSAISGLAQFKEYLSYDFCGVVLSLFSMLGLFYAAAVCLLLPLAGRSFRKHQVDK